MKTVACGYVVLAGPPCDQRGRFRLPGEAGPFYCTEHMLEVLRAREAAGLPPLVLLHGKVLRALCWKRALGLAGPTPPRAPLAPGATGWAAIEQVLGQEAQAMAWRVATFLGELSEQERARLATFPPARRRPGRPRPTPVPPASSPGLPHPPR